MKILLVNDHHSFGGAENYVRGLQSCLEVEEPLLLQQEDTLEIRIGESGGVRS